MRTLEHYEINTISGGEVGENTMFETLWVQQLFQDTARKEGLLVGFCAGVVGTGVASAIEGQLTVASAAFGLGAAACGYIIGYETSSVWVFNRH